LPDLPPMDAEQLSAFTGINQSHIQQFLDGTLSPDTHHLIRLQRSGDQRDFNSHSPVVPDADDMLFSPKGKCPDGMQIMQCQAAELLNGDAIPFVPQTYGTLSRSGQHWLVVHAIELREDGAVVHVDLGGGVWVDLPQEAVARIARQIPTS